MSNEIRQETAESLPLPKDWPATVRDAVLNVIGIVRVAMLGGREALIQRGDVEHAKIHRLGGSGVGRAH